MLELQASRAPLLLTAAAAESRRRSLPLVGVGLLALQASRALLLLTAAVAEAGWGRGPPPPAVGTLVPLLLTAAVASC